MGDATTTTTGSAGGAVTGKSRKLLWRRGDESLQARAVAISNEALDNNPIDKDAAQFIKKLFDEDNGTGTGSNNNNNNTNSDDTTKANEVGNKDDAKAGAGKKSTWHVIVGRNFGCSVTHQCKNVLFFSLDQTNILIFQSFV